MPNAPSTPSSGHPQVMVGALIGDLVGSRHEFAPIQTKDFDLVHPDCLYTDDTVMTLAVADALAQEEAPDFAKFMRKWGSKYVTSYGHHFWDWLNDPKKGAYGSWGNGAAMRVSPAAWFATSFPDCLERARASAVSSHDHPEAVRSAQATAAAIYAGLSGWNQEQTRKMVTYLFDYDLTKSVDELRETAEFEVKAWISVPRAIACALQATSFEDAIRNAVSLGGDADTEAAIAGSIAETWFRPPQDLVDATIERLPSEARESYFTISAKAAQVSRKKLTREDLKDVERWDPNSVQHWERSRRLATPEGQAAFATLQGMKDFEKQLSAPSMGADGGSRRPTLAGRLMRLIGLKR